MADAHDDALISRRHYTKAVSHEKAVRIMGEGRGTHFDPEVLDVFLEIQEEFREIARIHGDAPVPVDSTSP